MNKVVLSGYVASDIELKSSVQGTSVTSFTVAVRRPKTKNDTTDFLTVVAWQNTAEFVAKHFRKGSGIEISGVITVRKWQDKEGKNRYATEIVADEVDFGKRSKEDSANGVETQNAGSVMPQSDPTEIGGYDDVPF